ncbi:unnamed protein product [Sphenostylis stenocarpa]|uniref:SAC domain-containing protein n=1 Tax=Sphenostylis stenocarpa TaxID=92480 RepID=A0AA86V598_9FABA|nr:unnamed protein product [Sphenostylis stenocarpa]
MDIESPSGSLERFKIYDELELLEFQDKFVIKSHQSPNQGFWINRLDGNINLLDDGGTFSGSPLKTSTIYGVVGTIRLIVDALDWMILTSNPFLIFLEDPCLVEMFVGLERNKSNPVCTSISEHRTYAVVITSRKEVGSFLGFPVYRLMSMRILACNDALRYSTAQEKKDETYFADPRFVWNKHLLEELIEFKMKHFVGLRSKLCSPLTGLKLPSSTAKAKRFKCYSNIIFKEMYTTSRYNVQKAS